MTSLLTLTRSLPAQALFACFSAAALVSRRRRWNFYLSSKLKMTMCISHKCLVSLLSKRALHNVSSASALAF